MHQDTQQKMQMIQKDNSTQPSTPQTSKEIHMKKIAIVALFVALVFPALAGAEDMILQAKASKVITDRLDKNGNPFAIIFIQEERTLSGVAYTAEAPVFAMGPAKEEAGKVASGESFKAIVSKRQVNGDVTYTLRKIIK